MAESFRTKIVTTRISIILWKKVLQKKYHKAHIQEIIFIVTLVYESLANAYPNHFILLLVRKLPPFDGVQFSNWRYLMNKGASNRPPPHEL